MGTVLKIPNTIFQKAKLQTDEWQLTLASVTENSQGVMQPLLNLLILKGTAAVKFYQLFCRQEYKPSISKT